MGNFKIIEEGAFADFEFEARAESLEELFAICGQATFEAMTDTAKVDCIESIQFDVSALTLEDLLFTFLAELIYLKDVKKIFFAKYEIAINNKFSLSCKAMGEYINNQKHDLKTDVKAVTYHKLIIKKNDAGYRAR